MIEFIIGAFLYAKLKKKYKLMPIFKSWHVYPSLLCGVFYIFFEITIWKGIDFFLNYQYIIRALTLVSYVPLIGKYKLYNNDKINNTKLSFILSPAFLAVLSFIIGTTLNYIVISANSNLMPVFPDLTYATGYISSELVNDGIHVLGNANTKLIPLSDTIDIGYSVLSYGDLLVRLYTFLILYYSIKKSNFCLKL